MFENSGLFQKRTEVRKKSSAETEAKIKDKIRKFVERKMLIFMAAGFIAIGPSYELERKVVHGEMAHPDRFIEYIGEGNELIQEEYRSKLNYLVKNYYPTVSLELIKGDKENKDIRQTLGEQVEISGFERAGIDNKTLKEIWSDKCYPKGTVDQNLFRVNFKEGIDKDTEKLGIEDIEISAYVDGYEDGVVTFLKDSRQSELNSIDFKIAALDCAFSHEIGHLSDWFRSKNMSPQDRLLFLYEVVMSYKTPDSYKTWYVEEIKNKNTEVENSLKILEYWADLCKLYLSFPEEFESLTTLKEKNLIKKWLLRNDQDFDATQAKLKRQVIAYPNYDNKSFKEEELFDSKEDKEEEIGRILDKIEELQKKKIKK